MEFFKYKESIESEGTMEKFWLFQDFQRSKDIYLRRIGLKKIKDLPLL